jgi:hypothetical protein
VAGSNDPDFLRVVAPAKARKMRIDHKEDGKLRYTVFRDKGTWPLNTAADFTSESQEINVVPGEDYLVRVSFPLAGGGIGDGDRAYELKVSFK